MNIESLLTSYLKDYDGVAVAYSGGVDSTVLLNIVSRIFPEKHVGVFVDSPLLSQRLRDSAISTAETIGANLAVVRLELADLRNVMKNDSDRCYHCKRAIYSAVRDVADDFDIEVCLDGENASDDHDGRPGPKAASEYSMKSPFCDLSIPRTVIASYLERMRLPNIIVKDTCMATRVPMGTPFSNETLRLVEECESIVREISNVRQLRVRLSGGCATILTSPSEINVIKKMENELKNEFSTLGLTIIVDENGYIE